MQSVLNGSFFSIVSLFCVALSVVGSAYALVAVHCVRRFASRRPKLPSANPSVTLLKPLYGDEPGLEAALATFCSQDYRGKVQIVFGVQSPDDPAIAVAKTLMASYPEVAFDLVIDAAVHGINGKVSNLINMARTIRHDVVVLADSDIVVPASHLSQVVGALEEEAAGLVTCLYRGAPIAGVWSRLAAAAIDLHFLPSVLVGTATGLARPAFGSTIAMRRETLSAIGGFAPFADHLADDYAIGRAVRDLGMAAAIPPIVVEHLCSDASFRALWHHELRWARTIRLIDPAGFLGSGLTHALPFAAIGLVFAGFQGYAWGAVALALACRLLLWRTLVRCLHIARRGIGLVIVRDMLSFVVFVASFLAFRVRWRNFGYKIGLGGTMVPLKKDLKR
ncbi:MAG: bacteriohopanetetrol glucosamine biosynthesis glycosyltransferase HpnI [Methylobacteriaceae bacterium]|nr:bacteriohopanetetrol glucosamine biosynthesis glycosyltransferase HpnI [Methylobacteriaceae bacterium]